METIYRVQHEKDGRGPYRPGLTWQWQEEDGPAHPPIQLEFDVPSAWSQALTGQAVGCGFRTLEQLHRWFSPMELAKLTALGFRVVKLEVDRVLAESENQLIFCRSKPLAEDAEAA